MKQVYKFLSVTIVLLLNTFTLRAQVSQFHPGVTANGVTYALPKTVLKIQAEALRVEYKPGEFSKYAERFLHIQNVSQEASERYAVQQIRMIAIGEPDTNKVFTVAYNAKSTAPLVQLSPQGVLLSINSEEKVEIPELPKPKLVHTQNALDAKRYLTEEILSATSNVKMAELTAAEIYDLRENRNALLRGEAENQPVDGEALRLRLLGLQQQENALLQMFLGYTDTISVSHVYTVKPEDVQKDCVLFRFSEHYGFVDSDDLAGEPFILRVKDQHSVPLPTEKELQKRKLAGLVYNLPGKAKIQIQGKGIEWLNMDIPIAQFGTDDQLSKDLFTKGTSTQVTFSPSSGGILHISK